MEELPKMGRLCRALPDKGGVGAKAMWGARWVEKGSVCAGFFEQLAHAYGGDTPKVEPTEKPKPPPITCVATTRSGR